MKICNPPVQDNILKFAFEHLDCDCICEIIQGSEAYIYAYAENESENDELASYFYNMGYSGKYNILKGLDSREVGSID